MEAAQQKGRSRAANIFWLLKESGSVSTGWVVSSRGGWVPLSANVPSTRSQQAPLDFSRKAAVPSKEASHLEVICVVCDLCVHASGRPLFGSPSNFRCQQERPGCAHSSVPVQREWLWAPGILRASSERALLPFATQFRGKRVRPAQPGAFDGAQFQTGALPTQGGERLSNLKINVHGAKRGFNKNVNRRLASRFSVKFSKGLDAGATRSGRIGQGGSFETGWLGTMGVELLGIKRALGENC